MNKSQQVLEIQGTENSLISLFLPKLLGNVFHFTTSKNWNLIKESSHVATNKRGIFQTTSVHSYDSVGHHLDAVCLFDFRQSDRDVLSESSIFIDYLIRRWRKEPVYFLMLAPALFSAITVQTELDEFSRKQRMYIPAIESWHRGSLPLDDVERVYQVQVFT